MTADALVDHDAVILAGGTGRRLGGVDKARLEVGGVPLLARMLAAVTRARQVVVVAPPASVTAMSLPDRVRVTMEDPPGGGPVAGLVAGMSRLASDSSPWTLVAAVDQPGAAALVPDLVRAAASAGPEVVAVCPPRQDGDGHWLLALYRTSVLRSALAPYGSGHGLPMRRVVADISFTEVATGAEHVGDIDTWQDHQRWQERLAGDPPGESAG